MEPRTLDTESLLKRSFRDLFQAVKEQQTHDILKFWLGSADRTGSTGIHSVCIVVVQTPLASCRFVKLCHRMPLTATASRRVSPSSQIQRRKFSSVEKKSMIHLVVQ